MSTSSQERLCDDVLIALRKIIRAIDLHSKKLDQQHGVTGPQVLVLTTLLANTAPLTVGEVARRANLSQATVTDILDRLERRGLIRRERSDEDKRRVLVTPTELAAPLLRSTPPLLQDSFTARFQELQDWEQTAMLATLQRVAAMMDAKDLDAAPVLVRGPLTAVNDADPNTETRDGTMR